MPLTGTAIAEIQKKSYVFTYKQFKNSLLLLSQINYKTPMNKCLYLLLVLCLAVSCSADPEPEVAPVEEAEVDLEVSSPQVVVDQMISIRVTSEQPLQQVSRLYGDAVYSWSAFDGEALPGTFEIYFKFPSPGTHTLNLEFSFTNKTVVTRELQFEVGRGNSVQITRVEVNSFENINGSWDPEYSETDPERLADVEFSLEKLFLSEMTSEEHTRGRWFTSEVEQNQGDLVWDLSQENLFLDPQMPFFFAMGDRDENNMGQDLMQRPQQLFLKDYMTTRPESISLVDAESNLDVRFYLSWP